MIEVIDKINNTVRNERDDLELVIDPVGNVLHLKDYALEGHRIMGCIHMEDGSTLFCYAKIKQTKRGMRVQFFTRDAGVDQG